ncbi:ParB/RepB/Spo0J family partition protein [Actinophytocola sediminis]
MVRGHAHVERIPWGDNGMTAHAASGPKPAFSEDSPGQHPSLDRWLTVKVPIDTLSAADSPRLAGEVEEHAQVLAESGDELPPIVVHRRSLRVIDGMHRLRAARIRGETEIDVCLFDGDDKDIFLLAVQLNVTHGLPLSLADRTHAAARILDSHPRWSDRVIAELVRLSPNTVGAIRRCSTVHDAQSNTRTGRDGRVRPVNGEAGRLLASELITSNPDASLREVASAAGVAPSTAWRVRAKMRTTKPLAASIPNRPVQRDRTAILRSLKLDPSLRFTESGRTLLRWLSTPAVELIDWSTVVGGLPQHCCRKVADLARQNAAAWLEMAERLERQDAS